MEKINILLDTAGPLFVPDLFTTLNSCSWNWLLLWPNLTPGRLWRTGMCIPRDGGKELREPEAVNL